MVPVRPWKRRRTLAGFDPRAEEQGKDRVILLGHQVRKLPSEQGVQGSLSIALNCRLQKRSGPPGSP